MAGVDKAGNFSCRGVRNELLEQKDVSNFYEKELIKTYKYKEKESLF
ncbi:hypothetical protein [Brevibacillus laterosporus]|nr:hypothetical protein [Brevibacillus laterosporus]